MEASGRLMHRAREQFLADGVLDREFAQVVRPEILVSWRRSRLSGASANVDALPFTAEVTTDSPLCRAAEPVLSRLAEQLSGLQAGVLLADRNARILRRWTPQTNILPKMDRIGSAAGSSGSEELVGTNGIGTITEDRKPHLVTGAEHFADILSSFTCVGAPIFNPLSRKFEGVVTMNCDASEASPLLTSLIATTAQEIESRLLDMSSRRERALLDAFVRATRFGRAVAVIGDDVMLAGPQVMPMLRSFDQSTVWQLVREAASRRQTDHIIAMQTDDGLAALAYTPIHLDDKLIGALIELGTPRTSATGGAVAAIADLPLRWTAGAERLPGPSRLWQAVLERAAEQRAAEIPLLIVGEAGTGKLELAKAMFDDRDVEIVDCFAAPADDANWPLSIGTSLPAGGNGVVILRHVDALSPTVAAALSAHLDALASRSPGPRVVATALPPAGRALHRAERRILDQLGGVTIELPPLRDRTEDIPLLVRTLNERHARLTPVRFTPAAMRALERAPWPGNTRQLENMIRGIAATGHARDITPDLLPGGLGMYSTGHTLTKMEQLEMNAILETVNATHGNKVEMAKALGISRSTLYRKMRYYRVDPDRSF
jgi:transcriptional regulator of acetoin/glycerol metabolism